MMNPEEVAAFNAEQEKRGVVYLSRIPPFMKPEKIRFLLSQFGEIDHVYLTPENPAVRNARKEAGGNRKLKYTEGWVEFLDKKLARRVAESLNNTAIGGKKAFYKHDLWNIKYLPRFKWHHLTERLAAEKQERQQRLEARMRQATKEIEHHQTRADMARNMLQRQKRLATKQPKEAGEGASAPAAEATATATQGAALPAKRPERTFRQRRAREEKLLDPALLGMVMGGAKAEKQQKKARLDPSPQEDQ
ncbi:putative pre-rrna-processing protein esf2 [Paratrimastix pyriformis]|uniref:Pre-rrna-processing protein esf2 n=1 Tax=Paratrimastix pyriformis TaxID=342808 RepID=A0ABQ8UST1_9EUKA|nr:putative pre-rrna-processing protein esf2 [Paratrimastix pyriformis]